MRIEELILEGFKSYPVRTTITGWDSSFNAITGLNGSGKSNILDAICFVLGITNMSQMRAQNQQDLIYKRGQAGITKASVTIVFDNSDRATSPVGLENCKQITVTRQIALPNVSKYLLNGHKSQQHTIQTLFQSVQLNINNPNFLIMQGKITKVLNMRPQEILGMVEEAAGTRMFEERKDKATRTMAKKENRVREITSLLAEEITPKLDGLRAEKKAYLRYQKVASELERVGRVLRAAEWADAAERVRRKDAEMDAKNEEVRGVKDAKARLTREGEAAEHDVAELQAKREKELKKGGKYKKLEEEVAELEKTLVKIRTQVEIKTGTITDEERKLGVLQQELADLTAARTAKQAEDVKLQTSYAAIKEKHGDTQTALTNEEELLQSLLTGLGAANSGGGGGYMGQLADAEQRLAQASAEEEQTKTKLAINRKELKGLEARLKEVEREAGDGKSALAKMEKDVEALRQKVAASGWSAEKENDGEGALRQAKTDVRQLTEERDAVRGRMSSLDFQYSLPHPNFDRSKVKGLVASLISLDPSHHNKSTALEITAGGKLYNVVVQDETVGKDLLAHGRLRKRVTIIPLNKINAFRLSAQKLNAAGKLAPGKARPALSLVGYPDEVANAMAYVFGDAFVCDDAATAKLITFSRDVGTRSVTLDGDVYDPSGTLSGGAPPTGSGVLIKVQELIGVESRLTEARSRLEQLEAKELKEREGREKWKKVGRELEMKEHEIKLLREQMAGSSAARLGGDIENLKKEIERLDNAMRAAKEKQAAASAECTKLQKDMKEFKNNKEGKIDELRAAIRERKKVLQKQSVTLKTQQKEVQTAALELAQLEQDVESHTEQLAEGRDAIEGLREDLAESKKELAGREAAHAKADKKLQSERAALTQFDTELKELDAVIKGKKQAAADADLELKKLEHDLQALAKEKTTAGNRVSDLEKAHEWIEDEKDQFGKPGTIYDFKKADMGQLREQARALEEEQKGMKKKVNAKAVAMLEGVEKRETALKKMLSTVVKDREKIEETIDELDRYKRDALQKTWEKVNGDFGGIFAELLPGNFAKLQPPEGQDLTQGLEVKVRLGSVWKQSLTELSGGQRSLIALSLIMSLLQFKPAPMYILDEIDAALDLSHTQHIGQLFRTRFKGSQFIVVSLKEGLFTNANVLFRTRFRDGTSIVERTGQRSSSALYDANGQRS